MFIVFRGISVRSSFHILCLYNFSPFISFTHTCVGSFPLLMWLIFSKEIDVPVKIVGTCSMSSSNLLLWKYCWLMKAHKRHVSWTERWTRRWGASWRSVIVICHCYSSLAWLSLPPSMRFVCINVLKECNTAVNSLSTREHYCLRPQSDYIINYILKLLHFNKIASLCVWNVNNK